FGPIPQASHIDSFPKHLHKVRDFPKALFAPPEPCQYCCGGQICFAPDIIGYLCMWGDIPPSIEPQPCLQGGCREKIRLGDDVFKVSRRIGNQLDHSNTSKYPITVRVDPWNAANILRQGGKSFYTSNFYKDSEMVECC